MADFFVHNGYLGWSYGTPSDPQLISTPDAERIMRLANVTLLQAQQIIPPAQYAQEGDHLFELTGGNRFLYFGNVSDCAGVQQSKVSSPLPINWQGTCSEQRLWHLTTHSSGRAHRTPLNSRARSHGNVCQTSALVCG